MIHVACASDENYIPHCAAMLHSLLQNCATDNLTVHFLHGPRLSPDLLKKLQAVVDRPGARLNLIEIEDSRVTGLQRRGEVAGVMWYRIFLPELLPELDKVLYLDADTLVMSSLGPLWEVDPGQNLAAAVGNDFRPELRKRAEQLGLRSSDDYFNSGVMLMNLDRMRSENITQKILETARARGDALIWQDQDPFNIVFDGRWHRLHPKWNCQNSLFVFGHGKELFGKDAVREACRDPGILHFEGPSFVKPWHYLSKHPYQGQYLAHRARTPWYEVELEGRKTRNMILRFLPTRFLLESIFFYMAGRRYLRTILGRLSAVSKATS